MPKAIPLPDHSDALEAVSLLKRQSVREFSNVPVDIGCLGSVLYAAQGARSSGSKKLIPSAGCSYPLRIRVAARNISRITPGLYRYEPGGHMLIAIKEMVLPLFDIASAAFDANWLSQASAALLISAEFERTTVPYAHQPPEGRAERYVWLEAGHAAQNIALATARLSLATVFVGGFDDELMSKAFRLTSQERPIGVMPIGYS